MKEHHNIINKWGKIFFCATDMLLVVAGGVMIGVDGEAVFMAVTCDTLFLVYFS